MRVLVAEDHAVLAGRIAQGLRQAGMAVDAVHDGAAALEAAAQAAYDVIVLDRDLPVVHGDRVHLITAAARAASEHNLSARVAPTGPRDELRELAETFDEMLGRLQASFEGQQRFIANASHELRTPLSVMRATVDVVAGNPGSTPGDLRAMAGDIRAAVDHAEHLIGALFQRLSDRTSRDGSGLGLAIVASIAAIHGGTVIAHPRSDGGLTVAVTIPSASPPAHGNGIQATERPGIPRPS
jgi:signal transduction histidine kinase